MKLHICRTTNDTHVQDHQDGNDTHVQEYVQDNQDGNDTHVQEEVGDVVSVHHTHKWRNKRYWFVSWGGLNEANKPWPDSWEPHMLLKSQDDIEQIFGAYKRANPEWKSEFHQDCEDLLNKEAKEGERDE